VLGIIETYRDKPQSVTREKPQRRRAKKAAG